MATPHQENTFRRNFADRINLNITTNDRAHALNFELNFVNFKKTESNSYIESDIRIPVAVPNRGNTGTTSQYANVRIFNVSFQRLAANGNLVNPAAAAMPPETNNLGKIINNKSVINCVSGPVNEILTQLAEISYIRITLQTEVRTRYSNGTLGPSDRAEFHFYLRNHSVNNPANLLADITDHVLLRTNAFRQLYELAGDNYNIDATTDGDPGYFPLLNEHPDVNMLDKQYRTVWVRFFSEDDYLYCETLNRYHMAQPNREHNSVNAKRVILGYDDHGNKKVEFDMRNLFRTQPQQLGSDELHSKREIFINGGIPSSFPIFNEDLEEIFQKNGVLALGVTNAVEGDVKKLVKRKGNSVEEVRLEMNPNELYWKWIRFKPEDFGYIVIEGKVINVADVPPRTCNNATPVPDAVVHVLPAIKISDVEYTLISDTPVLTIPVDSAGHFKIVVRATSFPEQFVLAAEKKKFERHIDSTHIITVNGTTHSKKWGFNFDAPCGNPNDIISGKGREDIIIPLDSSTADGKDSMPLIYFHDDNKGEPLEPADKTIDRTDFLFKIKSKVMKKSEKLFRKPTQVRFGVFLFDSSQKLHKFTTDEKWKLNHNTTLKNEFLLNTLSDPIDSTDVNEFKKYGIDFEPIIKAIEDFNASVLPEHNLKDMTLYGLLFDCDNNVYPTSGLDDLNKLMKELNYINLNGPAKFKKYCEQLRTQTPPKISAIFDYDRAIVNKKVITNLKENKEIHKMFTKMYHLFTKFYPGELVYWVNGNPDNKIILEKFIIKYLPLLISYTTKHRAIITSDPKLTRAGSVLHDFINKIQPNAGHLSVCITELTNFTTLPTGGPKTDFELLSLDQNLDNPLDVTTVLRFNNIFAFYFYLYELVNGTKFKP